MNRPLLPLALAAALALSSCASTPESRIEKNPTLYSALTASQKRAAAQGQLLEGMSKDAVYIAWGRPAAVKEGRSGGKKVEKWRYVGHRPVVTNHFNVGYSRGYGRRGGHCDSGYGYYDYGPTVDYIPYTAAIVEFRNDKVSAWEREGR